MIIPNRYNQRGFTLIELLAVLSLAGLMMGVAVVPVYRKWLSDMRLETKAHQLFNDLQWTRNMAMRLHQPVWLCASRNQTHCGGNWEDGWLVTTPDTANTTKPLRYSPSLSTGYRLLWRGARHVEGVRFNANGKSAGYNGRFVLCQPAHHRRPTAWVVYVSQTGRIRLQLSRDVTQCK